MNERALNPVFPFAALRSGIGLSGRATLIVLAIVCASFVACASYIYATQSATVRASLDTNMANLSAASAKSVGNWLHGKVQLIQIMAQQIARAGVGPQADETLGLAVPRETFISTYVGSPDGAYREVPATPTPDGYDPRTRPWYADALSAGGAILTEPYRSVGETADKDSITITAAAPILDATRALRGVIGGDFDIAGLARMIEEAEESGTGSYSYLVSGAGTVLIHPRTDLVGKPITDLIAGPRPRIAPGLVTETREGIGRPTRPSPASRTCPRPSTGTSHSRSTAPRRSRRSRAWPGTWRCRP